MTYSQIYKALKKKILKDFGKRCTEMAWGCVKCEAWFALDFLESNEKEKQKRKAKLEVKKRVL